MIPLYILGILYRYGPQHGYQIKKRISEQLADFTDIKLPTIYYHLEKMEASGFITAQNVKEGVRPEKRVYCVSEAGGKQFQQLLSQVLDIHYRPTFGVDSALFFSDSIPNATFTDALTRHKANLEKALAHIEEHRMQVVPYLPAGMRRSAELIFVHHELHYQAELKWTDLAIKKMEG